MLSGQGDYHVAILHRNHLGTITAFPRNTNQMGQGLDFTDQANDISLSESQKVISNNVLGLRGGDADGNKINNAADRSLIFNERNLEGYLGSDVDLSGDVSNAADGAIAWNNRNYIQLFH